MARPFKKSVERAWRHFVVFSARPISLSRPQTTIFFACVCIIWAVVSTDFHIYLRELPIIGKMKELWIPAFWIVRAAQVLAAVLGWLYIARLLQICEPKYFEHGFHKK